jgi:ABC-type amino acid transport substrate-binding protein
MKKFLAVLFSLIALQAGAKDASTSDQPVYDRVNETNTIHCGYAPWPPNFVVDANTKKMSGIFYDLTNEVAKRLNLKVEWTEETGWSTVTEALKTHRFDVACSAFWVNSTRARHVDFSTPAFYAIGNVWVSAKNKRVFKSKADFNDPKITFSYMDGSAESKAIQMTFPKAKNLTLPELTSTAEQFDGMIDGKADAVVYDDASAADFMKARPGTIRKALTNDPVAIYPTVMLLPAGETKLKAMIDNTIREIQYDGTMQAILEKNNVANLVKLPAKPYQE